jgi:hypothetical protein
MSTRWQAAPDVLGRTLPDGVLLLAPGADEPLALLGAAARVWRALPFAGNLAGLVRAVLAGDDRTGPPSPEPGPAPTDVDLDRVTADVAAVLDDLEHAGLVLVSGR